MRSPRDLVCWFTLLALAHGVTIPPAIIEQPDYDVFYKAGETVEMPCFAEGIPRPTYTWQRNGITFNPSGNDDRVVQMPYSGTIVITRPEDKDEGIFQCFANNGFGTSVTIRINLREAKLKDFEVEETIRYTPRVGDPLTLNCVPPESIPPPQVFWVIKKPGGGFDAVNYDGRISMDHEYRLRITNVKAIDYQGGRGYACMAMNNIMRKSTQGRQYIVDPRGSGTEAFYPASYLWASPDDHFGLLGSNFTVKCIFAGNPTPDVHWVRTSGEPLPDRARIQSFGQELMISNLQFEDAGTYECWATNTHTTTRVQRTIQVRVESRPYWLIEPENQERGEGGTATFNCMANGVPEPVYFWSINGVSYDSVVLENSDPRIDRRVKMVRPDRLVFTDLTKNDAMVIQCNATNKHGYIFGDVYLNVLSEAPTILDPPEPRKVVAEGTQITIQCRVAGKPDPIITWFKDDRQITGGRYEILPSGALQIREVVLSDAGRFRCEAENTFNKTSAEGVLLVRRKTLIEQAPFDLEVNAGFDAKFTCSGTTDPEEVHNLKIKWMKDNKEISTVVQRMTTNFQDNSLTISGTIVRDSGSYTCIATNGLDESKASAMLLVKDRPDAATQVRIERCQEKNATIVWMPGSYNNAPVQYFIIQYNTSFNPDTWTFAKKVDSIYNTVNITMSPWVNYTFRVIAYNKIGESDPSFPTPTVCSTKDAVPDQNPMNLRTIGDRRGELHIEWTPMPQIQHNGDGFEYLLTYQKEDLGADTVQSIPINNWTQREIYRPTGSADTYEPYIITMRARNSVGFANQDPVQIRGFTGEDIPSAGSECTNAAITEIADTQATISWDFDYNQINSSNTAIQGEFRGFKIQFWHSGYKKETLREWNVSPEEALANRRGNTWMATIQDLLPNTMVEGTIAVMNNYYVAMPSSPFKFNTASGFPGPVELFRPINVGDNHVNLEWKPPEDDRGNILGYDIGYQTVTGLDLGEMQERDPQVEDPFATQAMLSGLLSNKKYRITIWARTEKGRGESYFIELTTTKAGDPQAPKFSILDVGQTFINVSWWINPYATSGTVIYVEYRREDAAEWLRTTDEVISSWKNISNLEPGTKYEVRVVATTGGVRRASYIEEVTTDGIALASMLIGNWGWFIGMLLAILLLAGLVAFFFILFKRGKRFSYHSPSTSYDGDPHTTYTDTAPIPKESGYFGRETRGFNNDYYDDKDHDDYGFDKGRGNEKHDDRDHRRSDYRDDDRDHRHSDYRDDDHHDYDDRRRDDHYDDQHYYEGDRYDDDRYDDRHDDDRRRHDDRKNDRRGYDDDDDRRRGDYDRSQYDPPSYKEAAGDEPYEEYERRGSRSRDLDRDHREPSRFDRRGAPVDDKSTTSGAASSTFV